MNGDQQKMDFGLVGHQNTWLYFFGLTRQGFGVVLEPVLN